MDYSRYRRYKRIIGPALRTRKTKAYGMLVLSLLTASFFIIFAIRPTVTTIAKLRKEINDDQYVEKSLAEKINTLTSLDQVYKEVESDLSLVEAVLPSQPNFENLLSLVENTATMHQLGILSIQFKPVDLIKPKSQQDDARLNPMTFQVTFTGSYQNLMGGLTSLNRANRLISIDTLEIKKSREAKEEELVLEVGGRSFCVN